MKIGIEVEAEFHNHVKLRNLSMWRYENDYSLRGYSVEYVLKKPMSIKGAHAALVELKKSWIDSHAKIKDTGRAGIHVHVDVNGFTKEKFAALYMISAYFDSLMMTLAGKGRCSNLFCIPLHKAPAPAITLIEWFNSSPRNVKIYKGEKTSYRLCRNGDNVRYASINLASVYKHGSLEFRGLKSTHKLSYVFLYIDLIRKMYELNETLNTPSKVYKWSLRPFQENLLTTFGSAGIIYNNDLLTDEKLFESGVISKQIVSLIYDGVRSGEVHREDLP